MFIHHSYFFSDLPALSSGVLHWGPTADHAPCSCSSVITSYTGWIWPCDSLWPIVYSKRDVNRGLMSTYTVGLFHLEGSLLEP